MKRISTDDFILMLSSIKFRDKDKDMILAYISIINDILLEVILNPENFKPDSFHFGTLIARGGKSIVKIFAYLVKNLLQQIDLFRNQCSNQEESVSVFKLNLDKINEISLSMRVIVIEKVVESCIFGLGLDFRNFKEAGFRLHSNSRSEEKLKLISAMSDGGNLYNIIENSNTPFDSENKHSAIKERYKGHNGYPNIVIPTPSKSFEHKNRKKIDIFIFFSFGQFS